MPLLTVSLSGNNPTPCTPNARPRIPVSSGIGIELVLASATVTDQTAAFSET